MKRFKKNSRKRVHSKARNFEPRNESITVMLSATEKGDFVEKCEGLYLDRSEQGRNLILQWTYPPDRGDPVLLEILDLKEKIKKQSTLIAMYTEKIVFHHRQAVFLKKCCSKNAISVPVEFDCRYSTEKVNVLNSLIEELQ